MSLGIIVVGIVGRLILKRQSNKILLELQRNRYLLIRAIEQPEMIPEYENDLRTKYFNAKTLNFEPQPIYK